MGVEQVIKEEITWRVKSGHGNKKIRDERCGREEGLTRATGFHGKTPAADEKRVAEPFFISSSFMLMIFFSSSIFLRALLEQKGKKEQMHEGWRSTKKERKIFASAAQVVPKWH